jgi:hypothetical protein
VDDRAVVAAFVAHLSRGGQPGLSVECRPDLQNRGSSDIDAIAGPFAIEHTSVDTIENQRRDAAWFTGVVQPLENQFRGSLPFRLRLVLPYAGITTGQDWKQIQRALAAWVQDESALLVDGTHNVNIGGVPFEVQITKDSRRRPGLVCVRIDPGDRTLPERLAVQLRRKAAKLRPYKARRKTTIILLDSNDMALMNEGKMLEAVQAGLGEDPLGDVDQLWYADTSIEPDVEFWDLTSALPKSTGRNRSV